MKYSSLFYNDCVEMYKHEGLFGSVEVLCGLYLWAKGLVFGVCCLVLAC